MLVMGNTLNHLLQDYNILAGRTWIFFLISILLAPPLICAILKKG